jgi:hypothetical protein
VALHRYRVNVVAVIVDSGLIGLLAM